MQLVHSINRLTHINEQRSTNGRMDLLPMDRTKEFHRIVDATEIDQPEQTVPRFYVDLYERQQELRIALEPLDRINAYEAFRAAPLLERARQTMQVYRAFPIPETVSEVAPEVLDGLRAIVRGDILRATCRINEAKRRCSRATRAAADQDMGSAGAQTCDSQAIANEAALAQEVQEPIVSQESLSERKRILRSISEIGQIVEDISIQTSLQGEQLQRIDDAMTQTDTWGKKALEELRLTWEIAGDNRSTMIKFFGCWFLIFLLFWFVKR